MITSEPRGIFSPVEVIGNERRSSWINVPEFSIVFEMEERKEGVKESIASSPGTTDFTHLHPAITTTGGCMGIVLGNMCLPLLLQVLGNMCLPLLLQVDAWGEC